MTHLNELYLDHACTTPLHPDALGAMLPCFGNHYGSSCSPSSFGDRARRALENARGQVADLLGAREGGVIFTSSGTEANNLAVLGSVRARGARGGHVVTSGVEHASVLGACRRLEEEGCRVTRVPVDGCGRVDPAAVEEALRDDTILVSVMHGNHVVGTVQPILKIGAVARARGALFHVDAAQSACWVELKVDGLPVDLLSISSHKLYGPKGVGALFVRAGTALSPLLFGAVQERGLRPGTENVPGIVGFGIACAMARQNRGQNAALVASLRESLEQQVLTSVDRAAVNASAAERLPHIASLSFEGAPADFLAARLDALGVVASSAPCPAGCPEDPSPVFAAMHGALPFGALRLSLGWENRERDVRFAVDCLRTAVSDVRAFTAQAGGRELVLFTFPDRENAVRSFDALKERGVPASLAPCPQSAGPGSPLALYALARDREAIGSILGSLELEIRGVHRARPRNAPMSGREREFWEKVEEIRKGTR